MKDVQKELITISTTLSSLVKQVEKMVAAIETQSDKAPPPKPTKAAKKAKPKKKAAEKTAPTKKAPAPKDAQTMLDNIFGIISRSRKGITVAHLKKKTGLEDRQVSNALYKLTKKGKIGTLSRGIYVKKKN